MAALEERQAHYPFGHGELIEMSSTRLSRKIHTGSLTMSNGVDLPLFGLGTWLTLSEHEHHVQQIYAGARRVLKRMPSLPESFRKISHGHIPEFFKRKRSVIQPEYLIEGDSPEELELALKIALDAGYRYFDTAVQYNNEQIIGKVFEKYFQNGCLKRSEIFLASKLPFYGHRPEEAEKHILGSLKRLRVDYIDLYLLHGPYPCKADGKGDLLQDEDGKPIPDLVPIIDTWRVFEKFYKIGKIKALGVTNFNQQQLHDLYNQAEIVPHNLQVECHVLWPQDELFEFCKQINITMTAYCPTGLCDSLESAETTHEKLPIEYNFVKELAKKYNKIPAQIFLRYMIQRGISVIPRSTRPEKIFENIRIFDFKLSHDEMAQFDQIKERKRLINLDFVDHHPWYPFSHEK